VVALYKQGVELPSDMAGVLYKPVDDGGAWRYELLKELRPAGVEADMNKVV
jgi:predicted nucleotide-binding protein